MTKARAKAEAWKMFSMYIRYRDAIATIGNIRQCKCFTCGAVKNVRGIDCIQAAHFIPGRRNVVLFDERQVHGGCSRCNIELGGNPKVYRREMVLKYGEKEVAKMEHEARSTKKQNINDYLAIMETYAGKIADLLLTIDNRIV
jgi:hypothetical protein